MTAFHAKPDGSCCDHYGVDNPTFICEKCGRLVGYCMGGSEDELCADCWCAANELATEEDGIRFTF